MIRTITSNTLYEEQKKAPAPVNLASAHKLSVFVGKSSATLGSMLLEAGYAGVTAEHPAGCENMLIRLLYGHGLLPDVIICDASFRQTEIRKLMDFLQCMGEFRNIPFLAFCDQLNAQDREKIRRIGGVDDIIGSKTQPADLVDKIRFLKKFKSLRANAGEPVQAKKPVRIPLSFGYLTKRIFDILIALIAILVLSPLMILIALLIKLESRGPVFYRALRAGTAYRVFKFIKFRTMVEGADSRLDQLTHLNQYGQSAKDLEPLFFKVTNDPRITRIGSLLRKTSLDEIPQLFNVIMGDMSLVGNRPLPLYEAATLTTDKWAERFLAPAGITGLWQIRKRGKKDMSVHERINLDIAYAKKRSFLYDMWIMVHTPSALIQTENV
ncbi:MAG TPA: sugar transferase [Chitinophagaceae bacterium]|nr:sugar transferase [Chitinophagaceae bacterium]